jgi:hypothetical protein
MGPAPPEVFAFCQTLLIEPMTGVPSPPAFKPIFISPPSLSQYLRTRDLFVSSDPGQITREEYSAAFTQTIPQSH